MPLISIHLLSVLFREKLAKAGVIQTLFDRFNQALRAQGFTRYIRHHSLGGGRRIDALFLIERGITDNPQGDLEEYFNKIGNA